MSDFTSKRDLKSNRYFTSIRRAINLIEQIFIKAEIMLYEILLDKTKTIDIVKAFIKALPKEIKDPLKNIEE